MTQRSIEVHGTLVPPNQISPNSSELHGTKRTQFKMIPGFHGIYRKSHIFPDSMEFHGNSKAPFPITAAGFHGIPRNIKWNSMELWNRQDKCPQFHGIPRDLEIAILNDVGCSLGLQGRFHYFHGNHVSTNQISAITKFYGVPWNFMEFSIEVQGTKESPYKISLSSCNSMELGGAISIISIMEIQGTLMQPNKISQSFRKFHGISKTQVSPNQMLSSSMKSQGNSRLLIWINQGSPYFNIYIYIWSIIKCRVKLLIHSCTATVQPLNCRNS